MFRSRRRICKTIFTRSAFYVLASIKHFCTIPNSLGFEGQATALSDSIIYALPFVWQVISVLGSVL